jgi:pyruvate dehydrogenase E2 component (dihydrolipoamide acetyltransferase)
MARSNREIPHYHLRTDIDLEAALTWLTAANEERPVAERILPAAVLMKAVALAVAEHRELSGFWIDDSFRPADGVHLGVAVSLRGGGLVAPALHDADLRSIEELMAGLRDLVTRARTGRLRGSEMSDPTITVTNLGDRGVEVVHGVIYPPQVALVGFGRISTGAAVVDGAVVPRRRVAATLAADHRASDGQIGARFLVTVDRLLQTPEDL